MALGELVRPAGERAGLGTTLPVFSVTKHHGFVRSEEYFNKRVFSKDLSSYKVVEPGHFAYATIHLDEGSIGIAPEAGLISPMYTVFAIDRQVVDPLFLIRYLKSPRALATYAHLGNGTAERRRSISLAALGRLPIDLPPLEEQRRIAAILDQADELQAKRRRTLALLDELMQSEIQTFASANFGNQVPLGHISPRITSGKSVVADEDGAHATARVLKISAVTTGRFMPGESKALPRAYSPPPAHKVSVGDLILSRANTADLVGASALVTAHDQDLYLPDKLWRIHLSDEADNLFLWAMLNRPHVRQELSRSASGSGGSMKNISQDLLRSIPIVWPDAASRSELTQALQRVVMQRERSEKHLAYLDELFASLQHRAFTGQL